MKNKRWISKAMLFMGCLIMQLSLNGMRVHAAGTLYESPYVTFSPDGKAWTTNQELPGGTEDGKPVFWYSNGDTISTGIPSSLRALREGEHYYAYARQGEVPVGYWKVAHAYAQCIHTLSSYPEEYHGIGFGTTICQKPYFSGWIPYCADCGEPISGEFLHYMSKEAAASINSIDVELGYYYLCPSCSHLEQGIYGGSHTCRQISYNRYRVNYSKNSARYGEDAYGSTEPSFHMYNNETVFEGRNVTPNTHLTLNGYRMEGYHFVGWNTKPDGSGTFYADGAEIFNLSTENYDKDAGTGTVTLYAQWKRIETNLVIDPNGGSYEGKAENTILRQQYGTVYMLKTSAVIPPDGYTITFETNGGASLPSEKSIFTFEKWSLQVPAGGVLTGEKYRFRGKMDDTDTIKALYIHQPIILPTPEKPNSSFGGWYRDPECKEPVGYGGDEFIPNEDTTLYAKWVELVLYAEENYAVNGGKGAVDLSWTQADGKDKVYQLYQSKDGVSFQQIYDAEETTVPNLLNSTYGCSSRTTTVTVPYTGFYTLTAAGAQGGDYDTYKGGKGGSVTGKFYLTKGEVLTITVGGRNGFNGGGTASSFGNGGGYTIISSDKKGTLLIGGGGGGATSKGNGGNGGEEVGLLDQEPSALGNAGESGLAGGGGGYRGGGKGVVSTGTNVLSTQTFDYKGYVESYRAPADGLYKLEVWGAQGGKGSGSTLGGKGGYSAGYIQLTSGTSLYVCVGGTEQAATRWENLSDPDDEPNMTYYTGYDGGYNGGGSGGNMREPRGGGGGGGATHIATTNRGVLANYSSYQPEVLIVAGGGGGAATTSSVGFGGAGGGTGTDGTNYDNNNHPAKAASSSFGRGAGYGGFDCCYGGGGGGWLGGGVFPQTLPCGGGGGSGYIGGVPEITLNGTTYTPTTENGQRTGAGQACILQYENVISPSYGGSNYINTKYAVTYSQERGMQEGDGRAAITSLTVGFQDAQSLEGVSAPDLAAPNAVNAAGIEIEEAGSSAVTVTWKKPSDNGTAYYHKAESYEAGTELPLCVSNITKNILVSGVKGYLYRVDSQSGTQVSASNARNAGSLLQTTKLTLPLTGGTQYLHLAAVDVAGNISGTTHVRLDGAVVAWELFTETLHISSVIDGRDYENIYPGADNQTWYARADGCTSFLLSFHSYMEGKAREDYQINYQILDSRVAGTDDMEQRYITKLPYTVPVTSTAALNSAEFLQKTEGNPVLGDGMYTAAARSSNAGAVSFEKAFTLNPELHGKTITVTPVAGADFQEKIVYSEWERDSQNALRIIADSEGPVFSGLETLSSGQTIDRNSRTVYLTVSASDDLSGVKEFYLKISNQDNFAERIYEPDESGMVQVDITEEDPLFTGDFTVTACAVDNVGNARKESRLVTEFALETRVERILEPHNPVFKRGESGILYITTYGYAERVEVEFPEELTALNPDFNRTFTYTAPLYAQEEQIQFMIPLYAPENENYEITVRAYKGDKQLEDYPSFSTIGVNGSVLDEIRTRLR